MKARQEERNLERKVLLISGGARGIGRAVGIQMAGEGWDVALSYLTSDDAAEQTQKEIENAGGRALAIRADVSEQAGAEHLVGQVLERWGHIDGLVNAVGPFRRTNIMEETPEGWRAMFAGNLDSVF